MTCVKDVRQFLPLVNESHAPVREDEEAHEGDERVVPPQDDQVDRADEELRLAPKGEDGDEGVGGGLGELKTIKSQV